MNSGNVQYYVDVFVSILKSVKGASARNP